MRNLILGVAAITLISGCSKGKKNVAACEDWLASLSCGDWDPAGDGSVSCDAYGELKCDVSEYFTCLTDATSCEDDVVDIAGWGECATKATCE
jgi:hypothetical protein